MKTYNDNKLYGQWYDIRSRAMLNESGQGALWRSQNNRSVEIVGVIVFNDLNDRNWTNFRIDSGTVTVNIVAANTNVLRMYRSLRTTYANESGNTYVDTEHGYTDLELDSTEAGQATATLSAANIAWLEDAIKDGNYIFCLYYAGDVATSTNPSEHYVRINSFAFNLEVDYAYSKLDAIQNADIGDTITVNWTNYVFSGRTNKLRIQFGSYDSGMIDVSNTSYQFTIPASWYAELPTSSSGVATVTLHTIVNGSNVGHDTVSFTASVGASIVPVVQSISATTINDDQTVAGWGIILQSYSRSRIDATCAAGTGASIVSYTINSSVESDTISSASTSYTYDTDVFPISGTIRYTLTVTDSRGRSGSAYVDIVVEPYASPTISYMVAVRCSADGTPNNETGSYAKAAMKFEWSQVGGNTMTNQIRYKRHQDLTYTVAQNNVAYWDWSNVFGNGNIDVATAYDVQGYVVDALGNTAVYNVILASVSGFHLGLKNDRARFGGVCERAGLEVDWESYFHGTMTLLENALLKTANPYPMQIKDAYNNLALEIINYNGVCQMTTHDAGTQRNYLGNGRFSCYDGSGREAARLSSDKKLILGNTELTEANLIALLNLI